MMMLVILAFMFFSLCASSRMMRFQKFSLRMDW